MDLKGSDARMSAALCRPVAACGSGLDPPNIEVSDSGCLDAWMLAALTEGTEVTEVTEVTAGWEQVIGRNAHTLELQELGRFDLYVDSPWVAIAIGRNSTRFGSKPRL
jgi:hypothetical protein